MGQYGRPNLALAGILVVQLCSSGRDLARRISAIAERLVLLVLRL